MAPEPEPEAEPEPEGPVVGVIDSDDDEPEEKDPNYVPNLSLLLSAEEREKYKREKEDEKKRWKKKRKENLPPLYTGVQLVDAETAAVLAPNRAKPAAHSGEKPHMEDTESFPTLPAPENPQGEQKAVHFAVPAPRPPAAKASSFVAEGSQVGKQPRLQAAPEQQEVIPPSLVHKDYPGFILKQDVGQVVKFFFHCLPLQKKVKDLSGLNTNIQMAAIFFATHQETWKTWNIPEENLGHLQGLMDTVKARAWKHVAGNKWRYQLTPPYSRKLQQSLLDYVKNCSEHMLPWEYRERDKAEAFVLGAYKGNTPPHLAQGRLKGAGFKGLPENCMPQFWIDKQLADCEESEIANFAKDDRDIFPLPRVRNDDQRSGHERAFRQSLMNFLRKVGAY